MSESLRDENAFHEHNRIDDDLVEVSYNDGDSVILHTADVQPMSIVVYGARIHYDMLLTPDGKKLEPYTISDDERLLNFGNELEPTFSQEGRIALQSKRHSADLGFLAIAETLGDSAKLKRDVQHRFFEDSRNYALDLSDLLVKEHYDLWIRLEQRQQLKGASHEVIMAKLAFMGVANDRITMVPYIDNFDRTLKLYIPEQLEFGSPWLYVAGENYDDFTED